MREELIKEFNEIMDSEMKDHWEIHKEKTPMSLRPYIIRMISEAYILGRADMLEELNEDVFTSILNQEVKDIKRFSKFAKTLINESVQETDREIQVSKRCSCS